MFREEQRILIIDDVPDNIQILMRLLKSDYKIIAATSGEKALEMVQIDPMPDLILLDIMMPEMDGYEVCRRLKSDEKTAHIPIVFVTALDEAEDEFNGLALGAVDYISKPFNPPLVKARVKNHIDLKIHRDSLEYLVQKRTDELRLTQEVTIESMATLAEYRDPETKGHIHRVQHYVKLLALSLKDHPSFSTYLTDEMIRLLYISAPLHDIGKVGISENILLKPGPLNDDEFDEMKNHSVFGHAAIEASMDRLGNDSFLKYASEMAYAHHEKWDGSGYPLGLQGFNIPVSARLMAIADVYDALISKRVYKELYHHEKAVSVINEGKGTYFDPEMVDAFNRINEDFRKVALVYADYDEERKMLLEGAGKLKVLIAEDVINNAVLLSDKIKALGIPVDVAENGKIAMEMIKDNYYMAILTEISLPIMDGYEMLEDIRKKYGKIPVIAVLNDTTVIDGEKAFRKGFDAYIQKSDTMNDLRNILGRYVNLSNREGADDE